MNTIMKTINLINVSCYRCDMDFSIPEWFYKRAKEVGETLWCPAGHSQVFRKPEIDRLRERLQRAEARATHAEDQRAAAERSRAALAGQVTKIRKRVGNGVCPCCNRSFVNVARHMKTKHPDYSETS